jgi:hypothetical protein
MQIQGTTFHDIGQDRALDRRHGFGYVELSHPVRRPFAPPPFWVGHFPADLSEHYFDEQMILSTGIYTVDDICVSGSGLLSRGSTLFALTETSTHRANFTVQAQLLNARFPCLLEPAIADGEAVLLTGPGFNVYGHWLVDFLPQLYLLNHFGIDHTTCRVLVPDTLPEYGAAWLELAGVARSNLVRFSSVSGNHIPRVIVPTLLRTNSRCSEIFGAAIRFVMQQIRSRNPVPTRRASSRIYVSRSRFPFKKRELINREEIEGEAVSAGYTIFHPEEYSLLDQMETFAAADVLVGEYGSALHGSVFARPGIPICALRWTMRDLGWLQSGLGEALGHPTVYVFGTPESDVQEGFGVNVADFRRALRYLDAFYS